MCENAAGKPASLYGIRFLSAESGTSTDTVEQSPTAAKVKSSHRNVRHSVRNPPASAADHERNLAIAGGGIMRAATIVIAVLVAISLLPMWFVAIQGEGPAEEVAIDQSVSDIRPLDGFLDTPEKLSPSQVGVIVWIALFGLYAVLVGAHRFMNRAVRPTEGDVATTETLSDGGTVTDRSWLVGQDRVIVEYREATESIEGTVVIGALTALTIAFAALFTGEYFTLARTQYFGVYAAGMFLSLAMLTVAYYAWFMPHLKVAERRGH